MGVEFHDVDNEYALINFAVFNIPNLRRYLNIAQTQRHIYI